MIRQKIANLLLKSEGFLLLNKWKLRPTNLHTMLQKAYGCVNHVLNYLHVRVEVGLSWIIVFFCLPFFHLFQLLFLLGFWVQMMLLCADNVYELLILIGDKWYLEWLCSCVVLMWVRILATLGLLNIATLELYAYREATDCRFSTGTNTKINSSALTRDAKKYSTNPQL